MQEYLAEKADQKEIKCKGCSASLVFKPGTTMLGCEYCGAENEIAFKHEPIEELDFEKFLADFLNNKSNTVTVNVVRCDNCKAQTELKPNIVADHCDFCGSPIAVKNASSCTLIKPKSLLPFAIDQQKAFEEFRTWVNKLWFAPNDLKKYANNAERLAGLYIPYWTYDAETSSQYTGMRGVNRTESYTAYENGKPVTRTRTRIDWYPASGYVDQHFDDVLVIGSKSLPKSYAESLEPWDLNNLIPFDEKFLSGFKTESYQVDLKDGYDESKQKMEVVIRNLVKKHIGGDHQQITTLSVTHSDVTFKHILLPIWISAFLYHNKSYRFMINGRTGEVQGERPYSGWKITFFVLTILAIIGVAIWFFTKDN